MMWKLEERKTREGTDFVTVGPDGVARPATEAEIEWWEELRFYLQEAGAK